MAHFRILGQITPLDGSDRYLCVVVAIPQAPHDDDAKPESESRILDAEAVHAGCDSMAQAMAARLRMRGAVVTGIQVE